jgi:tetratricopeptide (TPR) repeat protein
MHFNIRGPDVINRCDQKPAPGSYEELLSSLYDDFAREYFTLHELREVMKLAAAAEWIRKRNASFRLPAEGRIDWHSPARVPGLVYLYMTKQRVVTSANGGVRLTPFPPGSVNETFNDPSVVDARHLPLIKAPPPDLARSALAKVAAPPPTASPIGWVKSTSIKGQDLQVVSLTPGAAASAGQLQLSRSSDQSAASLSATNNLAAEAGEYRRLIAATSDPTIQAGYRLGLARVLHEQGDDAAAIKEVRQAQSLAPNHPGLLVLAAEAQLKSGDTKGAIDSLRRYVALAPYNWPAKSLLSELEAQEQFGVMPRPVADPGVGSRSGIAWKSKSQLVGLANVMAEPGAAPCWDISKGCRQGAATVPQFASRLPPLPPLPPQYKTDKAAIELWNKQIAAYDDFTKTQHSLNDIAFKKETNSATPKDLADEAKLLDDQAKKQKEIDENKEKMKQYVLVD